MQLSAIFHCDLKAPIIHTYITIRSRNNSVNLLLFLISDAPLLRPDDTFLNHDIYRIDMTFYIVVVIIVVVIVVVVVILL